MSNAFTLRQIAYLIASVEGKHAAANRTHQRLRALYQTKLLTPLPTHDVSETVAKQFDVHEVCRARMLLVLIESLDIDGEVLRRVDNYMRIEETSVLPNGKHIHTGLKAGIAGIQSGESWILELTFSRDDESGEEETYGRFVRDHQTRDPTGPDWMLPPGLTLIAYFKILATPVLRPLLLAAAEV